MQQVLIYRILLKKLALANLKSDVDKLRIDKLKNVQTNLSNMISDAVKNDIVKKTECNELVDKVNNIKTTDTSDLVKKLVITQKLMKLKTKLLLIIILINILLLKNLIYLHQIILLQD